MGRVREVLCTRRMRGYMLEWLLTISVIVAPLACAVFLIPFRNRSISLLDPSIQQPYYNDDSLPILAVFIPSIAVPLACFILYPFALSRWPHRFGMPAHGFSFHYAYWWSTCMVQAVGLTVLLSELSKRLVQHPRPDFLYRCFPNGVPDAVMAQARSTNFIINTGICTPETAAIYEDGLQSMPSEHTSLSWCMAMVLILFFQTLRREMMSQSRRLARAQRYRILAEKMKAAGFSPEQAALAARGHHFAPGAFAPVHHPSHVPAVAHAFQMHALPSPSPSPRPPGLLEDSPILDETTALHTVPLNNSVQHGSAAGPGSIQVDGVNNSDTDPAAAGAGGAAAGGVPLSALPRPLPVASSNASAYLPTFWPHSHGVFIAHILLPVGWAIAVSLSRAFDHKHNVVDIFAGAFIGLGVAYAVYRVHLIKFRLYHQRWNDGQDEEEEREEREELIEREGSDLEAGRGGGGGSRTREDSNGAAGGLQVSSPIRAPTGEVIAAAAGGPHWSTIDVKERDALAKAHRLSKGGADDNQAHDPAFPVNGHETEQQQRLDLGTLLHPQQVQPQPQLQHPIPSTMLPGAANLEDPAGDAAAVARPIAIPASAQLPLSIPVHLQATRYASLQPHSGVDVTSARSL